MKMNIKYHPKMSSLVERWSSVMSKSVPAADYNIHDAQPNTMLAGMQSQGSFLYLVPIYVCLYTFYSLYIHIFKLNASL